VLVVGFAVHQGREIFAALADRMCQRPDLAVRLCLNVRRPPAARRGRTRCCVGSPSASSARNGRDRDYPSSFMIREAWPNAKGYAPAFTRSASLSTALRPSSVRQTLPMPPSLSAAAGVSDCDRRQVRGNAVGRLIFPRPPPARRSSKGLVHQAKSVEHPRICQ
jgi:hypothetical protein